MAVCDVLEAGFEPAKLAQGVLNPSPLTNSDTPADVSSLQILKCEAVRRAFLTFRRVRHLPHVTSRTSHHNTVTMPQRRAPNARTTALANARAIASARGGATITITRPAIPGIPPPPDTATSRKRRKSYYRKMRNMVLAQQRLNEFNDIVNETTELEHTLAGLQTNADGGTEEAKTVTDDATTEATTTSEQEQEQEAEEASQDQVRE